MRFLSLLALLLCCACQNTEPAPEQPPVEEESSAPIPDLVQPKDPSGIPLQTIEFADSALLAPAMTFSPQGAYHVKTFAARSDNEAFNTVVNTTLASLIAGEEAPIRTTDLRKVVVNSVKTRLLNYKKQSVDTAEVAEMPVSWMLDIHYTTEILHNANDLLTMATTYYAFTGGAHGNYNTEMHNFDLASGKQLAFEDLFLPDSKDQLLSLLQTAAPEHKDVYPTDNIALTKEGVLFDFPPYDIEAYAAGEIEVLLPYVKVEELLTETGLAVAKRMTAQPLGREG